MKEEKERILKMLEEGTINAGEAYRLLESIEGKEVKGKSRLLRIHVEGGNKENVNIKIPLSLASKLIKLGGGLGSKFSPDLQDKLDKHDIDLSEVADTIEEELGSEPFTIADIEDGEETVKIWVE